LLYKENAISLGMRNAILTHRHTGCLSWDEKLYVLELAADVLDARIDGGQTTCQEEFNSLAAWHAAKGRVPWFFVGDGSLGAVLGALPKGSVVGYLPGGTGCAINYALGFPRPWAKHGVDFLSFPKPLSLPYFRSYLGKMATRIEAGGRLQALDLLVCEEGKGLMASIGAEPRIFAARTPYKAAGLGAGVSYSRAIYDVMRSYDGIDVAVTIDGKRIERERVASVLVTKMPHYGLGMLIAPKAKLDDGFLHVRILPFSPLRSAAYLASSFTIGNYLGEHHVGRNVVLETPWPEMLQLNGDLCGSSMRKEFTILDRQVSVRN
jgi:diacylglycerol kinase family enzyme